LAHVPVMVVLGLVAGIVEVGHAAWERRGLGGVDYVRHLDTDRVGWGDEVGLTIEVWNRTGLPLPWVRADDDPAPGITVLGQPLVETDQIGDVLRNVWSLAPSERVFRHLRLVTDHRGVFTLGPVRLTGGDLFARATTFEERGALDRFIVRPRVVAAPELARPDRWGELERARTGLTEDPSRFAGIRPWVPGDSIRRIHPRASARLRQPMVKRYEPSRDREVLIALDIQIEAGSTWSSTLNPDEVEALYVVAASLATSLERGRSAFGIVAAGYAYSTRKLAEVPISDAPGQAGRVLDLLARLSTYPSTSYERLLAMVRRTVRAGTVIVAVTCRDPGPFLASFRHLERAGCQVVVLATGPDAVANVRRARAAGITARTAVLDGPWPSAGRLLVA
ncbi:MAG TPA: DUF58 domain-containing protein, partial [Candidatus Limnocylindrales bacterium]|nr:DUF58 domain-containing protein [Candidatus Limnocylindrales bacterium]